MTIHKCQGLTLDEIVVDMSPAKGHSRAGQGYVAFSRVQVLKSTQSIIHDEQICVSHAVALEMNRLRTNPVPCILLPAFPIKCQSLNILHLNIAGLHTKIIDVQADPLFKQPDVISLNETHMVKNEVITTDMLGITNNFVVFSHNCDTTGGGIALAVNKVFAFSSLFSIVHLKYWLFSFSNALRLFWCVFIDPQQNTFVHSQKTFQQF